MKNTNSRKKHKNWILIILSVIVLSLVGSFLVPRFIKDYNYKKAVVKIKESCKGVDSEAILIAKGFCERFNLACGDKLSIIENLDEGFLGSLVRRSVWFSLNERYGTIVISYNKKEIDSRVAHPFIYIVIDCKSKEVVTYTNRWIKEFLEKQQTKTQLSQFSKFMPENEAREIVNSIALKLELPKDMVLEKMEKNSSQGVWNAFWIRQKDGIPYEDEWISISIMGVTGEFVAYIKRYHMESPSTMEINITKEKATELGWNLLKKNTSNDLLRKGEKINDLYRVKSELHIIQADKYDKSRKVSMPFEKINSKLVWYVNYEFYGGLARDIVDKPYENMTQEEKEAVKAFGEKVDEQWVERGFPYRHLTIRIDASTGNILYTSLSR